MHEIICANIRSQGYPFKTWSDLRFAADCMFFLKTLETLLLKTFSWPSSAPLRVRCFRLLHGLQWPRLAFCASWILVDVPAPKHNVALPVTSCVLWKSTRTGGRSGTGMAPTGRHSAEAEGSAHSPLPASGPRGRNGRTTHRGCACAPGSRNRRRPSRANWGSRRPWLGRLGEKTFKL